MTSATSDAATRTRCGCALARLALAALACAVLAPQSVFAEVSSSSSSSGSKDSSKESLTTNHQLLSGLGLARLPAKGPLVHATEDDSRVFVVRLPPSQHYYSLLKPPPALANSVSKQVEVGFRSNGKPARVYHWNIPVLKKMAAARRRSTQGSGGGGNGGPNLSLKAQKGSKKPSKGKLAANRRKVAAYHRLQQQQQQQQHQQQHQQQQQQHMKLKQHLQQKLADAEPAGPSPYFYAPAKKTSMHKLLGGNGKPHTMYVLEKSRTPAYYQRLLP